MIRLQEERNVIEAAETDASIKKATLQRALNAVMEALDAGYARAARPNAQSPHGWEAVTWIKKAIISYMKNAPTRLISNAPGDGHWCDKVPSKFRRWRKRDFDRAKLRVVPPAAVRYGAYIAPRCVIMPSFINVGAHVGKNTMIDSWATIGSCAQIGQNCHISGGVGIGGVLEPVNRNPVVIEDNCFIGARSEITEGVVVGTGSVLSTGVFLTGSTPIVDRATGIRYKSYVPPFSVVIPGSIDSPNGVRLPAAIIVKTVDRQTREKTAINDLLR